MAASRSKLCAGLITLALAAGTGCAANPVGSSEGAHGSESPQVTTSAASPATTVSAARPAKSKKRAVRSVLAISVDGLNPDALRVLGPSKVPNFFRLMAEGAYTLNARTEYELTRTLPNHTGMLTGRPIDTGVGGHGVTFNEDNGSTVQRAAGHKVKSVYTRIHRRLGSTALFASKDKFDFLNRSWPTAIDRYTRIGDNDLLTTKVLRDLNNKRPFRLVHFSAPDGAGHQSGWLSDPYLTSVQDTDRRLGRIMAKIDRTKRLRRHLMLLVTADHGGAALNHSDPALYANYRVGFFAWGRGVKRRDLYDINPTYADPGLSRPTYAGKQPIRNGDIANLASSLLGLRAVKNSRIGKLQTLTVYDR